MERNDFFKVCQSQATGKTVTVEYDSIAYYPIAYQLAYNADGTVRHTAVLQDVKSRHLFIVGFKMFRGKYKKLLKNVLTNNILCGILRPWNSAAGL